MIVAPHFSRQLGRTLRLVTFRRFDTSTADGRSKERYRRIAPGTLGTILARSIQVLTAVISVALTVKYLGAERYGLWATISSVLALLAFADLGLGNGLVNVIAEAHGRDDQNAIRKAVSTATFMLAGIAVLLLLAFALVYPHVPWPRFFNVTSDLASRESGSAMAVFFVCFAINLPLGVVQRVQMGFQETGTTALWQSAGYLLSLGGVVLAVYLRAGLPWLVLAMAVARFWPRC